MPSAVIGMRSCGMRVLAAKRVLEKRHCEKAEAHDSSGDVRKHTFHSLRMVGPTRSLRASHALKATSSRAVPYTGIKS